MKKYNEVKAENFTKAIKKATPEMKIFISEYSAQEYKEMNTRCYLAPNQKSGYCLKPDGDIISVFSIEGGCAKAIMISAIENGGTKLDCIGEDLVNLYSKFGFKEYERWTWNDEYAPEKWYDFRDDQPDIVLMSL